MKKKELEKRIKELEERMDKLENSCIRIVPLEDKKIEISNIWTASSDPSIKAVYRYNVPVTMVWVE